MAKHRCFGEIKHKLSAEEFRIASNATGQSVLMREQFAAMNFQNSFQQEATFKSFTTQKSSQVLGMHFEDRVFIRLCFWKIFWSLV